MSIQDFKLYFFRTLYGRSHVLNRWYKLKLFEFCRQYYEREVEDMIFLVIALILHGCLVSFNAYFDYSKKSQAAGMKKIST